MGDGEEEIAKIDYGKLKAEPKELIRIGECYEATYGNCGRASQKRNRQFHEGISRLRDRICCCRP